MSQHNNGAHAPGQRVVCEIITGPIKGLRTLPLPCDSRHLENLIVADIAYSIDFRVFFATSIKARSFGAKEARRG